MNVSSLTDHQKNQKQNGKWNTNVGESSKDLSYYVKLAPESPLRKSTDVLHDESSYDSFHNYETDICKDSSDEDYSDSGSSHTEGYAVMDVIEYELPDDSESDDVSSASSGTDDFTISVATAACFELKALTSGHLSDDDDSDFILADTGEDSDGSIDLELGQADYWKCVKCNNKQNNPRFRYCERCYQVRKSLFPPRPRRQKSRTEHNRKRKMAQPSQDYSSSEVESESDAQVPSAKKIALSPRVESNTSPVNSGSKNGNQLNIKDKIHSGSNKHANSAGELSCNNNTSSDDGDDGEMTLSSDADRNQHDIVRKIKVSPSSSIEISKVHVADCSSYSSLVTLAPSHVLEYKLENKLIQSVYRQELLSQKRPSPPNSLEWKDSGLSSCQESSQDLSQEYSQLSPLDGDGALVRSTSSGSTRSFDSQSDCHVSQASTQIQQDSDESDNEEMLRRVEEFRQEKMKQIAMISPSSMVGGVPMTVGDSPPFVDINDSRLGICRFCMANPKNGVFVHNNCLHLCCCYKCALKVWKKRKSCPICNCKIKNVTKLFVH